MQCECGHWHGTDITRTVVCKCGRIHRVYPGNRPDGSGRDHLHRSYEICGECDKFGEDKNGHTGCTLLPSACHLPVHFINGGGCLDDPPKFPHAEQLREKAYANLHFAAENPGEDLVILTCHFNPGRYKRLRDTYCRWLPTMGDLAERVRCVELVLDDDEPEIEGSWVVRGTRERNVMFQKETLLNLGIARTNARYVAWIDHDIAIENVKWAAEAIAKLDAGASAVQLFSRVVYLDAKDRVIDSRDGCPGGAWMATREFLIDIGGLYQGSVMGGDDTVFHAVVNNKDVKATRRYSVQHMDAMQTWMNFAVAHLRGDTEQVEGVAYHLWHGDHANRQYGKRNETMARHNFDPAKDVRLNDSGILEWVSNSELREQVANYFRLRRDDG